MRRDERRHAVDSVVQDNPFSASIRVADSSDSAAGPRRWNGSSATRHRIHSIHSFRLSDRLRAARSVGLRAMDSPRFATAVMDSTRSMSDTVRAPSSAVLLLVARARWHSSRARAPVATRFVGRTVEPLRLRSVRDLASRCLIKFTRSFECQ
jgi:hypothetical protein